MRDRARDRCQRRFNSSAVAAAFVVAALVPQAARAATITKGPFLQALGATGVTIKLELSAPEALSIEISGPNGLRRSVAAASAKSFHAVRIGGLEPSTSYTYEVRTGEPGIEPGHFMTAPQDDRPFRFLVYGDSRSDHTAHAAVVRAMEATPADFLVHTGDMVHTGSHAEEWQTFFTIERALLRDRCVFAAVGNHELTAPNPAGEIAFLRYFASVEADDASARERSALYGSFRWSNTRFFLLNAMDTWSGEERRWLREELARSLGEPGLVHRIAVLHHGPFSSGPHGGNTRLFGGGIVDLLREHRVSVLLAGHDHAYERGEGGGVKYILSGGAGAPLYARRHVAPETQVYESVHHFVEVSIQGEAVETLARRASGGLIERCSFLGTGPWQCGDADGGADVRDDALRSQDPSSRPQKQASCRCELAGQPSSTRGGASGVPLWIALGAMLGGLLRRRFVASASRDA